MRYNGITSNGIEFKVWTDNENIYFEDELGGTLEWFNTQENIGHVTGMIKEITEMNIVAA